LYQNKNSFDTKTSPSSPTLSSSSISSISLQDDKSKSVKLETFKTTNNVSFQQQSKRDQANIIATSIVNSHRFNKNFEKIIIREKIVIK
jgi:N-acetylmuramoyl-L-alanine amidase CwlA